MLLIQQYERESIEEYDRTYSSMIKEMTRFEETRNVMEIVGVMIGWCK